MQALFLALALAVVAPQQPAASPVVRGQVLSETTGDPLPYARVELVGAAGVVTYADRNGRYRLPVPPGRRVIRASHVDHAALEVEVQVPNEGTLGLELELQLRPVRLRGLLAHGVPQPGSEADTVVLAGPALGAAARALDASSPALAELGMIASGAPSPGGNVDPAAALYVRGAASDLKLLLLDGAPVYTPFHLAGLISPFEPDVLQAANVYVGGAPARFDGGLSYVMDLETRSGRRPYWHTSGGADLISARTIVEGPIGERSALLASARGVHGWGARQFTRDGFPYQYWDGLARVDVRAGSESTLSATVFHNLEAVQLDRVARFAQEAAGVGAGRTASWGNTAGSIRYRAPLGGAQADLTVAGGTFRTRLPVGSYRPLEVDGRVDRVRVAVDLSQRTGTGVRLNFGASVDALDLAYDTRALDLAGRSLYAVQSAGVVTGGYFDARWDVIPQIELRGGVRMDSYSTRPSPRLAPRASVRWLLNDRAALTLAAGVYRQYMLVPVVGSSGPTLSLVPAESAVDEEVVTPYNRPSRDRSRSLSIARGSHVTVKLDQELGEGLRLGVEGYYKQFDRLPGEQPRAEASGFDVWTRRTEGRVVGWLGYSLAWIWASDAASTTSRFAGRHLLTAGLSGPLAWRGGFDIRIAYGAGLPYAAVPEPPIDDTGGTGTLGFASLRTTDAGEPEPGVRAPDESYLRVDATISRTWLYRRSSGRGAMEITPYIKVLNALDRRDALFWYADPNGREVQPVAALPVLPIFGVEWKF